MARLTPKTKVAPPAIEEMEAAGYPDAEPNGQPPATPTPEPEMPERFSTGGASAEEIAEWKAAHAKGKKP